MLATGGHQDVTIVDIGLITGLGLITKGPQDSIQNLALAEFGNLDMLQIVLTADERPEGGKNLEVIPIDEPSKIIDSNLLNYDELEKVNGIGPISAKKILMICKNKDDIPKKLNELYFRLHDNVVRTLLKYYKINIKEGE